MYEAKSMLFLCAETPLHAGTGRSLGTVDLPIQRERATGYPLVQASSVKGRLRAEAKDLINNENEWLTIFGPEQDGKDEGKRSSDFGGALSTGDARILLFPVRSLAGVFAWVTCVDVLARFQREATGLGLKLEVDKNEKFSLPGAPSANQALISSTSDLKADASNVVLEEFSFAFQTQTDLAPLAKWLANHALPQTPEYLYWRENLSKKLCILPENAFRDFVLYGTEVQTHIALDQNTKTVKDGALWTSESLPVDTVLYAPVQSSPARNPKKPESVDTAQKILAKVTGLTLPRMHLGGDETTGQGVVALHFVSGGA
jgi:CRISPR-associated protein Cmr4